MKSLFVIGAALLGGALTACATPHRLASSAGCAPGERAAEVAQLFFGRNIGDKPGVSEADWDAFLDRELVSRFPEGLSVIDTAGVWRGKDGVAIHELGKAVVIVLSGSPGETARIAAVTEAYKSRFSQDSVLTSRSRSCVAS